LYDLDFSLKQLVRLYYDNKTTCNIAHNLALHDCTKYVEIDKFFIKNKLENKIIKLSKIKFQDQSVDILTKTVSSCVLLKVLDKLGMYDIHAPT
jgi:hypothetical protein